MYATWPYKQTIYSNNLLKKLGPHCKSNGFSSHIAKVLTSWGVLVVTHEYCCLRFHAAITIISDTWLIT